MIRFATTLLAVFVLSGELMAAVKITTGTLKNCYAANRGAFCEYISKNGQEERFYLPSFRYSSKLKCKDRNITDLYDERCKFEDWCADPSIDDVYSPKCKANADKWELEQDFTWKVDGRTIAMLPHPASDWAGPDLPGFDKFESYGMGASLADRYQGCKIKIIQRSKAVTVLLNSHGCK